MTDLQDEPHAWRVEALRGGKSWHVRNAEDWHIATCYDKKDADQIVRDHNAEARLRIALEALREIAELRDFTLHPGLVFMRIARRALEQAEGLT